MKQEDQLIINTIQVKDLNHIEKIGLCIGRNLKGGELIELSGDLGSGKTTLSKYIVAGSGSNAHVSSPTFTISKQYKAKNFTFYHYDFYRLNDAGLIANELADHVLNNDSVVLVEWGSNFPDILPSPRIIIKIGYGPLESRVLHIEYPKAMQYITVGIE